MYECFLKNIIYNLHKYMRGSLEMSPKEQELEVKKGSFHSLFYRGAKKLIYFQKRKYKGPRGPNCNRIVIIT